MPCNLDGILVSLSIFAMGILQQIHADDDKDDNTDL